MELEMMSTETTCYEATAIGNADDVQRKKRAAPLRMTKQDAQNVLKEIRKYPKKDADHFITKREALDILRPGVKELFDKKGYNEREIVGILRHLKAYNYTPKDIAAVVCTTATGEGAETPLPDEPHDAPTECPAPQGLEEHHSEHWT